MQVAGAEVLVKQLIERLGDRIEPTVFCLDDVGELGYRLRDQKIPVIVLDRKPGFDLNVAKRLADEVRSRKTEVLHAHQYTPFFYAALARVRYRAKVKILFTEHGRHFPDVVSTKRRLANRILLQHYAEVTTACCDFSTEALRRVEGFSRAFTLANGVSLSDLPPRGESSQQNQLRTKLGLDLHRPYAACIARFHPVKDHATLIRAWAKVHHRLPEARLLLVGDGEERDNIERLIVQLSTNAGSIPTPQQGESNLIHTPAAGSSLADSVKFLGIRDDVGDILRAINVFTLTSVSEAASLTLLEAMASECASVVTNVGGNPEHLREAVDGYLVPRADDETLADRLVDLLSDPETASEFGRSARRRVQEKFNLIDTVNSYYRHYQTLSRSHSIGAN